MFRPPGIAPRRTYIYDAIITMIGLRCVTAESRTNKMQIEKNLRIKMHLIRLILKKRMFT
jgi:hypothetical protein